MSLLGKGASNNRNLEQEKTNKRICISLVHIRPEKIEAYYINLMYNMIRKKRNQQPNLVKHTTLWNINAPR